MASATLTPKTAAVAVPRVFDRIVCGIDGSEESLEAARQAARLLAPGGALHLHAIADIPMFRRAGSAPGAEAIISSLTESLEQAACEVEPTTSTITKGSPVPELLRHLREEDATLVALGAQERGRTTGVLRGSVGTALLHDAHCSVLVARRQRSEPWPDRILVGVDGSAEAAAAAAVARQVRARVGAALYTVAALGGKEVPHNLIERIYPRALFDSRRPVDALRALSEIMDLLIVGSRGLHGIRAVGSVSERIAHAAHCSVLVVRPMPEDHDWLVEADRSPARQRRRRK